MAPYPRLDDLIALALAAGREILSVRDAGFATETKDDGSLVTRADQQAEAVIEAGLASLAPGIPMIGEEAVAAGRIPATGERFFCVDALDGTRGFAKGGDEFTVNIALVEHKAPVMGVVFAPAAGDLYAGEPGRVQHGRFDGRSGAALAHLQAITARRDMPAQWRIAASDFSGRNSATAAFIAALGGDAVHASSSVKFCRLAEGAADLYPRFGNVNEWDTAAGHAVLNAAGGGVMRPDGAPLLYEGANGGFLISGFIAYASDVAKQAALDALKR
ncbi:MAG: inositol monophosphatase family protein [Hyphomonadaceae bacterium]